MSKISTNLGKTKPQNTFVKRETDFEPGLVKKCLAAFAILCVLCTMIFDKTQAYNGTPLVITAMLVLIGTAVYLKINDKLTWQNVILLILAAGFVLRLNYCLYTVVSATIRHRQHDIFDFGSGTGHSGYIEFFYENGFKLPDFNPTSKAQFYHPPLHHFLAALWMRILTTFGASYDRAIGSIQFLTLFYSCCVMLISERILDLLNIIKKPKAIALAIIAFHPSSILIAGSINNDGLAFLFMMLAFYAAIRWYKDPTTKNILLIALSIGAGMSTKLSVVLVAPPIALLFLIKLIKEKKKMAENIRQYCIFGCVCLPLGLWYSIRNFIKFEVPFNYVMKLSETSDQYVGFHTAYERLFDMSYHPFENTFLNRVHTGAEYFEYNPFVSLIKTSLFGEYKYENVPGGVCRLLLIVNILLIALSIVAMVYCCITKSKCLDRDMKIYIVSYHLLLFINFIVFSFQYPHNCSMDFRYILPTMITGALFVGLFSQQIKENTKKKDTAVVNAVNYGTIALVSVFCLLSAIVYVYLGTKK